MILLIFILLFSSNHCQSYNDMRNPQNPYTDARCEPLIAESCKLLNYNETYFPNHLGHNTQNEAIQAFKEYQPLISIECSPHLNLFLCSLYFPVCASTIEGKPPFPLKPCKSLCLESKRGCAPLMEKFNFKWPQVMDCDLFKESKLCLTNPKEKQNSKDPSNSPDAYFKIANYNETFTCPVPLKVPSVYNYRIIVSDNVVISDCGMPCDQFFYSNTTVQLFSRYWIGFWACMCTASTLFTILTFLTNTTRLQYPERPIIYLSLCYFMVSIVYIAGFVADDKIACSQPFKSPDPTRFQQNSMSRLVAQGTHIESCIITFIMGYFFWVASCVWFVILTFTWYLAAKLHWAHESIAQNSQYFHFIAWTLPAIMTITALLWNNVDGDPLSGVCFISSTNPLSIKIFILAPLGSCLILGCIFLMAGFFALFRIRKIVRNESYLKSDKLEKLIIRISMFSVLYIIPAAVVIGCLIYETESRPKWTLAWMSEMCRRYRPYIIEECFKHDEIVTALGGVRNLERPIFEVIMIKYLMFLIVGVTSGIWIWNIKTLKIWKTFLQSLCLRRKPLSGSAFKEDYQGFSPMKYANSTTTHTVNLPISPLSLGSSLPSSSGVGLFPAPPPPSMAPGMCSSPDMGQSTSIDDDSGCNSYPHGRQMTSGNNYNLAWNQQGNSGHSDNSLIPMASL